MNQIRQLSDIGYFESVQINYSSSSSISTEEEIIQTGLSALGRRELEVILDPSNPGLVKEEIEPAQENILTSSTRNPGNEIHPSESKSLQLQFSSKISQSAMTGKQIKGERCDSIEIALVDVHHVLTGQVVTSGPLASAKVEMVVLKGDFDAQDWTVEEFNKNIVIDMEGKRNILNGKTRLNLKEGVGVLDEISFKHSSSWTKKCELRLGARVVDNPYGIRVKEAKTERFTLTDRRPSLYGKHHPPSLGDEVWRLEKIWKRGAFHKRLIIEKVNTVKDFLTLVFLDPARLREILGTGMSAKVWEVTVDHARTCILDGKLYFYCPPGCQEQAGVVFSIVGQLMGLLSECHYDLIDRLSETEKADAHNLVKSAFEHWEDVVSFDKDAYLMGGSSGLSNVLYPLISSKRASSDRDNILNCHKKTRFDCPQPSVSSRDITPSFYSTEGVSNFDDFMSLHNKYSKDLRCDQPLSFPVCDTELISQAFCGDEDLQYFDAHIALQSHSSSWDSPDDFQSDLNAFLLARSTAQRRWRILFSVLKCFSMKRIVASRTHVEQVQSCC